MFNKIKSEKGATFIEAFAVVFILMMFSSILFTATHFFNNNQSRVRQTTNVNQVAMNKVLNAYAIEDWSSLTTETVDTNSGMIDIKYYYNEVPNSYGTRELDITINHDGIEKTYTLERSVLH